MKSGLATRWLVGMAILLLVVGMIVYSYADWPGSGYIGIANKNGWDYLELLIVPAALALGVYWLNRGQQERQRQAEEAQRLQEQQMEDLQRQRELEVARQRAMDAALESFLDKMESLLIEVKLGEHPASGTLLTLIRARTLTLLERLDGSRKRAVLRFLSEAGWTRPDILPKVDLNDANFSDADLTYMRLSNQDLSGARFANAKLVNTNLSGTDLRAANLSGADLTRAQLGGAGLSLYFGEGEAVPAQPNLTDQTQADLTQADLSNALGWTPEQLDRAKSLDAATMPDGRSYAYWVEQGWLRTRKRKTVRENGNTGNS